MSKDAFDEKAKTAFHLLLERFWILREREPELYQLIREREKVLKRYIDDKFGFDLIVHQHFIKLEKLPVEAKSWMGMQKFQEPRDYAMFCCALAFTESCMVEEQFLLSDICEEIKDTYPGEFSIDWTNYDHRRSLVRVMKQLEEYSVIRPVEGKIEHFSMDVEQEVLYEATIYARYFMRSYPRDLSEFHTRDEILETEWERHQTDYRRKRVYRQLILAPVVYRTEENDDDFLYIRNYRNRLRDDLEEHTMFRLEIFKNAAILVAEEKKQEFTLFPDQKAITDVAIHFATYFQKNLDSFNWDDFDCIRLTETMFEEMMTDVHKQYGKGWSKQYREGPISQTKNDLIRLLLDWEMLEMEEETRAYVIKPLLGRISGFYPKDWEEKIDEKK